MKSVAPAMLKHCGVLTESAFACSGVRLRLSVDRSLTSSSMSSWDRSLSTGSDTSLVDSSSVVSDPGTWLLLKNKSENDREYLDPETEINRHEGFLNCENLT